ncbi:MAG: hypothetical protein K9W44_01840 [Candidatus Lokiarchaeota archaeon]|nr:hypothetical protein [Candidatus Harpocratesius repetitus]
MKISLFFIELLEKSLENIVNNLSNRINFLRNNHYLPNSSSSLLIEIEEKLTQYNKEFHEIQKTHIKNKNISDRHQNLLIYIKIVNNLSTILNFIENSATTDFNPSVFYLIEDTINKLADNIGIIINSCEDLNYYEVNLRNLLKNVGISNNYFLVILPKYFKDDIFHLTLLFHEIGHFMDSYYRYSENIEKIDEIKTKMIEKIRKKIRGKSNLIEFARFIEKYSQIFKKWLREFIADYIAIKIVGFPYFLSFCFVMAEVKGNDDSSESHPPNWLRMRILRKNWIEDFMNSVNNSNLNSLINQAIKNTDFIFKKPKLFSNEREYFEYWDLFEEISPIIKDKIDFEFPNKISFQFEEETINELKDTLKRNVPPSEIFRSGEILPIPVNFASIINAAWFFLIENNGNYNQTTIDLLLKSIENSFIKSLFLRNR